MIAALDRTSGACHAGIAPRFQNRSRKNVSRRANAFAFSLAASLMVSIVIFRAGDGTLTVVRADEYEGEVSQIVREIDPHER